MTRRSKQDTATKVAGGVKGARSHQRGTMKKRGSFVGVGALRDGAPVVELTEWEFLGSRTDWSRKKLAKYLLDWCNASLLLRGETDLPAFSQLVTACELIQKYSRRMKSLKNPDDALAVGLKVMQLWDKVNAAIARMDLKGAQAGGNVKNLNEEALSRFE